MQDPKKSNQVTSGSSLTSGLSSKVQSPLLIDTNTQPQYQQPQTQQMNYRVMGIDEWLKKEAPRKLGEAMDRLKLDPSKMGRNLELLPVDELVFEKKRVKNELKCYDSAFQSLFGRLPVRQEKEPMRPLYVFYKKLKQILSKMGSGSGSKNNESTSVILRNENSNSGYINTLTVRQQQQQQQPQLSHQSSVNTSTGHSAGNSISGGLSRGNSHSTSLTSHSRDEYPNVLQSNHMGINQVHGYSIQQQQNSAAGAVNNGKGSNAAGGITSMEANKKLSELRAQRSELRDKLHKYQADFTKTNNRKIKYHKDIAPVESEYQRYKEIKNEIARLEGVLGIPSTAASGGGGGAWSLRD